MIRSVATAAVGTVVLAALTGCAYQQSFGLPELTPRGASPGAQVYPSYGYGYGYGAGYPGAYPSGYGNVYGYASPYYAAQGPYPYSYGYAYDAIPRYLVVPCADNNRDGRCDTRPPRNHHDRDQHDHDDDDAGRPAQPRDGDHGEEPRVRNRGRAVAPTTQQTSVPAARTERQRSAEVRSEQRRASPAKEP